MLLPRRTHALSPTPNPNPQWSRASDAGLATEGCVGFNTHNVMKAAGCAARVTPTQSCDLYLTTPLPPTPPTPPLPPPYPHPASQRQNVGLWPLPRNVSGGGAAAATLRIAPGFVIRAALPTPTPTLVAIIERYSSLVLLHGRAVAVPSRLSQLAECTVAVGSGSEELSMGMDESYTLEIVGSPAPSCRIEAATFVGAQYGLETLSQLVLSDGGGDPTASAGATYTLPGVPWKIADAPRFPFRGLMVDTSRHFLPLNALRRQIDGLSFSRMNVLHWHITDAQSTPYDSVAYPKLKQGAFRPWLT